LPLSHDDSSLPHGGLLVPAILAEAEAISASGERMVQAYAAGYETWAELFRRDPDPQHQTGWHPTSIFGSIASAAACASLRGLDAEQSAMAIALGASQSGGLISNFGTMTKPFHAGRAAHAGILSARLVANGFTASPDALEHPPGFLHAVSHAGLLDLDSPVEAGVDLKLLRNGLSVKKYPLCFCTHRALDGMLDLAKKKDIDSRKVKRITVSTSSRNATILRNHTPQTGLEAKFSMEFSMACALIAGAAGLAHLTDDFVRRADVQDLMKRVIITPDDRPDPNLQGYAIYDQVTVETANGERHVSPEIRSVRGDPGSPLTRDDLWAKFEDCVRVGGKRVAAEPLFDSLMSLDRLADAGQLWEHAKI
jgi:2-methylcitrate dehydratase PrpD